MHDLFLQQQFGNNATIQSQESFSHSRGIKADLLQVATTENYREERAVMVTEKLADGNYSRHLFYILPQANPSISLVYWLRFFPAFFDLFDEEALNENAPFRLDIESEQEFIVCHHSKALLAQMHQVNGMNDMLQALHFTEIATQLFRRAIEHISIPFTVCAVPACRFLAYDSEREKILEARKIHEQSFDQLISIKDLSRKVAMNECYLKKGFKTLTGKTINEFQQDLRIGRAKELLQQQGQTVSEVANTLGYSSISHFSTAFKKATGLKPCELLA
jgi:AraC-like DNA-binding protein